MEVMGDEYCSSIGVQELHVLAVDDSSVDRKVIERLLKISACKGVIFVFVFFLIFNLEVCSLFVLMFLGLFLVEILIFSFYLLQ